MLKVNISNRGGGRCQVEVVAQGSLIEIMAEVGQVIAGIHNQLRQNDPRSAKAYRKSLIDLMIDPESPLWDEDPNVKGLMITMPKTKKEDT